MAALVIAESRQYLATTVAAPGDLSGVQIEIAIFQIAPPTPDQWHSAEWDPDQPSRARVLVGPGTAVGQLAPGPWKMRIRLVKYPEFPHLDAGSFDVMS